MKEFFKLTFPTGKDSIQVIINYETGKFSYADLINSLEETKSSLLDMMLEQKLEKINE